MAKTITRTAGAASLQAQAIAPDAPSSSIGNGAASPKSAPGEMSDEAFERHLQKVLRIHRPLLAKLAE